MSGRMVVILSMSEAVIERVRLSAPTIDFEAVSCLGQIDSGYQGATLVIDPAAARPCCVRRLRVWRRLRALNQVIFLCLPAAPEVLLTLPWAHPGVIADLDSVSRTLRLERGGASTRAAWLHLGRDLKSHPGGQQERQFITLAEELSRNRCAEAAVAAELKVSVRTLSRLAQRWFGFPPRVIFGLVRVKDVARRLLTSSVAINDLAVAHGYPSRQAMIRQFRAYTGLTPTAYRMAMRGPKLLEGDVGGAMEPALRVVR